METKKIHSLKIRGTKLFKVLKSKIDTVEASISGISLKVHPLDWFFWITTSTDAWECETIQIYKKYIYKGSIYCDIGAWIGPTTMLAASLGAEVTCFEPDPHAYERLLFNIRNNFNSGIQAYQIAISGSDSIKTITPISGNLGQSSSSLIYKDAQKKSAEVLTLSWDSACKLLELPIFDFIKIDIEGSELELIPVMIEYIKKYRPKIFISTHFPMISEHKKNQYIDILKQLWDQYPNSTWNINEIKNGYPAFLLE